MSTRVFEATSDFVSAAEVARMLDPKSMHELTLDALVNQSVIGPIGLPAAEAVHPPVTTRDGSPMNARYDCVIRMSKNDPPPAGAIWSVTLYDTKNGFFIPNGRRKYSVDPNAGMMLDGQGGITMSVATRKPGGVPEENWLPIVRRDENVDLILRTYVPDLEKFKSSRPPQAGCVQTRQANEECL